MKLINVKQYISITGDVIITIQITKNQKTGYSNIHSLNQQFVLSNRAGKIV